MIAFNPSLAEFPVLFAEFVNEFRVFPNPLPVLFKALLNLFLTLSKALGPLCKAFNFDVALFILLFKPDPKLFNPDVKLFLVPVKLLVKLDPILLKPALVLSPVPVFPKFLIPEVKLFIPEFDSTPYISPILSFKSKVFLKLERLATS